MTPITAPPARDRKQRKQDTLDRLEEEIDAWVATADPASGTPYMVPLSFLWDGSALLFATPAAGPTGRNLRSGSTVRLGIGATRDVVLVEGDVEALAPDELPEKTGDAFAEKTGFDPRQLTSGYLYFRVRPLRIQAWREANELAGRELLRDGEWLA